MAAKPSKMVEKTSNMAYVPNERERAASQFGQLDGQNAGDWAGNPPKTIQEAIERIAAAVAAGTSGPIA
jgi:hypothetical protein